MATDLSDALRALRRRYEEHQVECPRHFDEAAAHAVAVGALALAATLVEEIDTGRCCDNFERLQKCGHPRCAFSETCELCRELNEKTADLQARLAQLWEELVEEKRLHIATAQSMTTRNLELESQLTAAERHVKIVDEAHEETGRQLAAKGIVHDLDIQVMLKVGRERDALKEQLAAMGRVVEAAQTLVDAPNVDKFGPNLVTIRNLRDALSALRERGRSGG